MIYPLEREEEMKEIAIKENHLYNKTYTRGKRFVGRYVAVYVLRDLAAKRLKKAKRRIALCVVFDFLHKKIYALKP